MTESVLWQSSTGYSVSDVGPVRIPLLTVPSTTPTGPFATIYALQGSSSPGSQDIFSNNRGFSMDFDGILLDQNGGESFSNGFTGDGNTAMYFYVGSHASMQNGGTLYLTVNLGTPTDSGSMPFSDAGAVLAMVIDPGVGYPAGRRPRPTSLDGGAVFFPAQNRTSSTGTVNAAVAPSISIVSFGSSVGTNPAVTFPDPQVVLENSASILANSVQLAWATYMSPIVNTNYAEPFLLLPPASPTFSHTWNWTTATFRYAHNIQVDSNPELIPVVVTHGHSSVQWVG